MIILIETSGDHGLDCLFFGVPNWNKKVRIKNTFLTPFMAFEFTVRCSLIIARPWPSKKSEDTILQLHLSMLLDTPGRWQLPCACPQAWPLATVHQLCGLCAQIVTEDPHAWLAMVPAWPCARDWRWQLPCKPWPGDHEPDRASWLEAAPPAAPMDVGRTSCLVSSLGVPPMLSLSSI